MRGAFNLTVEALLVVLDIVLVYQILDVIEKVSSSRTKSPWDTDALESLGPGRR